MNISQLKERIAFQFKDIEQIDNSIIRFIKKSENLPFAVYYLDITEDIPNTKELLKKYQDRVIGKYYFEGKKSLQWSNYLYFVTNKERLVGAEFNRLRDLIEGDRNYARKFVISEQELDEVINPPVISPAQEPLHASVLSVWTEKLVEAGLDNAILSDDDIPTRLKLIEKSSIPANILRKTKKIKATLSEVPPIRTLNLINYRSFPLKRDFEFGTVNLIVGANGAGKTSLLEAIELFYCGRNRRNPNVDSKYKLTAIFANGKSETVSNSRTLQEFRDRNLAWYGQPEVRTNNLYQSFAQFNFLDTDAAVNLATDDHIKIEDDLSKLLIGPEASKMWRDIERVNDSLSSKLRELHPLETQIKQELVSIEKQLKEAQSVQKESDSITARLKQMLDRLGWSVVSSDNEDLAEKLIEALSELLPLLQQATKFDWIRPPLSLRGLERYSEEKRVICVKAKDDIALLDTMRTSQSRLTDSIKKEREVLNIIDKIKKFLDSGIYEKNVRQKELDNFVAKLSNCLGRFTEETSAPIDMNLELSLNVTHEAVINSLSKAQDSLNKAKSEYKNFSALRIQSANLAEELRLTASKIISTTNKVDECPLCHTEFKSGELAKHMNIGVDQHMEALAQAFLIDIQRREVEVQKTLNAKAILEQLQLFCDRIQLPQNSSLKTIIYKIDTTRLSLSEAIDQLDKIDHEILELEAQGLSMEKLQELSLTLSNLGYFIKELSKNAIEELEKFIQASEISPEALEVESKKLNILQQEIAKNINSSESRDDISIVYSQLMVKLAATEKFQEKLSEFNNAFPWAKEKPLIELEVEAQTIRNVATDIQLSVNKENAAKTTYTDAIKRKEHLEKQLERILPRITRFTEAQKSLTLIQRNYSLNDAMSATLNQNRAGIEKIFSHIHSPAEFNKLGSNWRSLIRKSDNTEAKLTEISTGQRAAFALSIFMARNAQLSKAPPIILIDDPIAHVDDLNSLSFLDYLRDVVLKGHRQIFFATANEKLATLFQRKFDFLDTNFKRFDLRRGDITT